MAIQDKKEVRIESRLPVAAKQQIEHAAALQGRTVSDFVVQAALDQANKVIEEQRIIRLTVDESISLANLMASQPKANKNAVAAFRRYKEIMGD